MEASVPDQEVKSNPLLLLITWLWVGVPLLWGIEETIKKAMALFS